MRRQMPNERFGFYPLPLNYLLSSFRPEKFLTNISMGVCYYCISPACSLSTDNASSPSGGCYEKGLPEGAHKRLGEEMFSS